MINNGSEWRKWDLHVHTPESIAHDYKKGEFKEVWDRYFHELENLPSDVCETSGSFTRVQSFK